jgi:hypothetical protein
LSRCFRKSAAKRRSSVEKSCGIGGKHSFRGSTGVYYGSVERQQEFVSSDWTHPNEKRRPAQEAPFLGSRNLLVVS